MLAAGVGGGVGGILHRQKLIYKYCEFVSQQKGQPFLDLILSLFIFSKWKPCSKWSVTTRTHMYSQSCRLIFFFYRQPPFFPHVSRPISLFQSCVSHFFPCFLQPAKVRSVPSSRRNEPLNAPRYAEALDGGPDACFEKPAEGSAWLFGFGKYPKTLENGMFKIGKVFKLLQ